MERVRDSFNKTKRHVWCMFDRARGESRGDRTTTATSATPYTCMSQLRSGSHHPSHLPLFVLKCVANPRRRTRSWCSSLLAAGSVPASETHVAGWSLSRPTRDDCHANCRPLTSVPKAFPTPSPNQLAAFYGVLWHYGCIRPKSRLCPISRELRRAGLCDVCEKERDRRRTSDSVIKRQSQ